MTDEGMDLLQKRVQQAIGLVERIREENQNLKNRIVQMQDEIQKLKEEANALKKEREEIKGKIDTATSMLDKVDLENMLDEVAKEVAEETDAEEDESAL
jgi:uncharacterized coiled-coil DUF342 family protein